MPFHPNISKKTKIDMHHNPAAISKLNHVTSLYLPKNFVV